MALYQNKYRVETARLKGWDYANAAAYFVTICTKDRRHWFGQVENGQMVLNELGQTVQAEWLKSPELRPDMNLVLDEFVVMPNHFHGIIFIGENEFNRNGHRRDAMHGVSKNPNEPHEGDAMHDISIEQGWSQKRDAMHGVSTDTNPGNHFGSQSKNLGSIIRGFKSAVTIYGRKLFSDFAWQERYHDHIIRNQDEFLRIQQYIINNPVNWQEDKFYTL